MTLCSGGRIAGMRAYIPFILVGLAVFSAACIAFIAWDLTSEKSDAEADEHKQTED